MGIERDINQNQFLSENQKALLNIVFTGNVLVEQVKNIVAREDITVQQFNILRILRGAKKPISTLQIRERMLDKMSDTSRLVDRLLLKHLVVKVLNSADKRLVDITISTKGKRLLTRLDQYESEIASLTSNLNEKELQTLNALLDKIRPNG